MDRRSSGENDRRALTVEVGSSVFDAAKSPALARGEAISGQEALFIRVKITENHWEIVRIVVSAHDLDAVARHELDPRRQEGETLVVDGECSVVNDLRGGTILPD